MSARVHWSVLVAGVVAAGAFGASIYQAWPAFRGVETVADANAASAGDLSAAAVDISKFLVGLATAILASLGLLMSEKVSQLNQRLSKPQRRALAIGALAAGLSICTGFLGLEVALNAANDQVVKAVMPPLISIHWFQATELAVGVILIGSVLLAYVLRIETP